MISLDQLLSNAQAKIATDKRIADERAKLKKAKSADEVDEINSRVKAWEEAQVWHPTGRVLRLNGWVCRCGARGLGGGQELIKLEHNRIANTTRLLAPDDENPLPHRGTRELIINDEPVEFCAFCAKDYGYERS